MTVHCISICAENVDLPMQGEKELSEKLETLGTEIGKVQEQWHSSQAEVQRQQGELEDAVEKLEEAQKQLRKEEANSQVSLLFKPRRERPLLLPSY